MPNAEDEAGFGPHDVRYLLPGRDEPSFRPGHPRQRGTGHDLVLMSGRGPDGSPTNVMEVWLDSDYRVTGIKLSNRGGLTGSDLRRFPWSTWLRFADYM